MGIFDLIKLLAEKGIDFVLVGGLAAALQGYQRVTMDVDVVLAMDTGNLERFIAAARDADLRRDALMVEMGNAWVPVASIPHLIAMKTGTGRGKDQIDIDELKKLMPGHGP